MSTVQVIDDTGNTQTIVLGGGGVILSGAGGSSGSGLVLAPKTKSANYTLLTTDSLILANANGGNFNLTLPTAVGFVSAFWIVAITTNNNLVTLLPTGTQKIANAASVQLGLGTANAAYKSVTLVSDNANWWVA